MWSSEVALVHLFLQNPYPSYPILRIFLKGVGTNNDHYYYFNHYEFEICGKKCCNGASPTFCFRLWIGLFVFLGAYAPSCLVYGYNYRGNDYYILPVTYSLYIHCNVRVLKSCFEKKHDFS